MLDEPPLMVRADCIVSDSVPNIRVQRRERESKKLECLYSW